MELSQDQIDQLKYDEPTDEETCEEEEEEADADSDFEMQGQALPVAPFDINHVDTTAVPLSSQEYLQQVIAERARLPRIVTATVPKLKSNLEKSKLCIFPNEEIVDSPHKPTIEWQEKQISHFSNLRYKVECEKESWGITCVTRLPNLKNDWFNFLFEETQDKRIDIVQQPYLDIVLRMSHEMIENVIKYLIEWISEGKVTVHAAGVWLFALLTCIEVPICIKVMNRLRFLVHFCRKKREEMDVGIDENKAELSSINLFICIIGKYFSQHDLAD